MPYLLGIDVSTTATKALLIDPAGKAVAAAASEYTFDTPHPLWSEQEPALWWEGAQQSIRLVLQQSGILPTEIAGIGLTGQMHGLVLLDEDGEVLRPAILWNDQRTGRQCDEIRERVGPERLIQLTGNDALPGFTASKILWVKGHEPEYFERARHLLLPKDYVRFRLTGVYATDKADAAGTLLLNIRSRDWSGEVLQALGIPHSWMPAAHEGPEITGRVTEEAALATGLAAGTPVVAGGSDQAAQAIGVGAIREGVVALTLGTSGVVFASSGTPFFEPQGHLHAFCHAVPNRWHLMGVVLSAAGSLRWYRDTLAPRVGYDTLLEEAADIPPGSDGLLFLPYLTGERTPYPDPLARGAFVGLTIRHTRAHMTRAVLEGVAYALRDSFLLMERAGLPAPEQVRLSGGGARNEVWRQILADVLNTDLVTVTTSEGAAFGAALLAGVGAGIWPDVDTACSRTVRTAGTTSVQLDASQQYAAYHYRYRQLYPALKPTFEHLAEV